MSYSSVAEVRLALTPGGDSTDRSTAAGVDDITIQSAIDEADAVIDSYIGRQYAVPVLLDLDSGLTPQPIRAWSRNIAAYNVTLVWRRNQSLAADNPVALRYTATMVALTAVRDGKATLQIPDNTGAGAGAGFAEVVNQYTGSMFVTQDYDLASSGDLDRAPWGGNRRGIW